MKLHELKWRLALELRRVLRERLPPGARQVLRERWLGRGDAKATLPLRRRSEGEAGRCPGPAVTVVIPCYNYGRFVGQAIDSALRQTLQDAEIIVVDDGSTDPETIAVLDRIEHPRIRMVRQANAGLPAARNAGIELARGHYICCLDADDALEPTYLEKCVSLLESNPGIGLAYSWLRLCGDASGIWKSADLDLDRLLLSNHVIVSAVFRRQDWQRVGGYSAEMRGGYEDWEFWLRLAAAGVRGRAIPEPLFLHHRHGRTMTHEANAMAAELVGRMRARNRTVYDDRRLRRRIREGYADVQLERPFANLDRPEQFLQAKRPGALLVLLGKGVERLPLLEDLARHVSERPLYLVSTAVEVDRRWPEVVRLAEAAYHLPNFLAERDRSAFLRNFVATRGIGALSIVGQGSVRQTAAELEAAFPALTLIDSAADDGVRPPRG